jgi:hypothetical protein
MTALAIECPPWCKYRGDAVHPDGAHDGEFHILKPRDGGEIAICAAQAEHWDEPLIWVELSDPRCPLIVPLALTASEIRTMRELLAMALTTIGEPS